MTYRMTKDPDRDEIVAVLEFHPAISEADEGDREEAIYWFARAFHEGQWSRLYSIVSTSPFRPGPLANGPEPEYKGRGLKAYKCDAAGRLVRG